MNLSVVIPVFRGEETLKELFQRIHDLASKKNLQHEVIMVHDGGSHDSWEVISELKQAYPNFLKAIKLSKNYGQNAATQCGIAASTGEIVVTIDEDLQTPPEEIEKLLKTYATGEYELIYGIPERRSQSALRRAGAGLTKSFFKSIEGLDIGSSFRLMSRALINRMKHPDTEHLFINQVVNWYTDRVGYAYVQHTHRASGKSGYRFFGLIEIALRLILFYSDFLLRIMVYAGVIISVICVAIGGYFIYEKYTIGAELGFTSLIVAVFFSTGLIITCLSVIGLYIQRIFKNQMGRPVYAIEQEL